MKLFFLAFILFLDIGHKNLEIIYTLAQTLFLRILLVLIFDIFLILDSIFYGLDFGEGFVKQSP